LTRAPSLVARVRGLGPAFDLLAAYEPAGGFFFERSGLGVATSFGLRLTARADREGIRELASRTLEVLRGVEGAEAAHPPVAVGSVPFADDGMASMVVPSRLVQRASTSGTIAIDVAPEGDVVDLPFHDRSLEARPGAAFADAQLDPLPSRRDYAAAVRRAAEVIRAGPLRKVVLARTLTVDAGRDLDAPRLLRRLRAVEPAGYAFGTLNEHGLPLVGASPELLVACRGREVRANPLAGSAARSGDPEEDRAGAAALARSSKDRLEHAIVVEAVDEALGPFCGELIHDLEPVLHETANVWHLSTRFRGRLREPRANALELVAALHPTPAVCGTPHDEALRLIAELEPFDRSGYAGAVGWMDAEGDGEWAIALRCAEIDGPRARLFAGAGIVAGSDPALELDETERKFRAFLDALRWG
jgi:isochorismate synthase